VAQAPVVVVGRVTDRATDLSDNSTIYSVAVDEALKGTPGKRIQLKIGSSEVASNELFRREQNHEDDLYFVDPASVPSVDWRSLPLFDRPPKPEDQIRGTRMDAKLDAGYGYYVFSIDLSVPKTTKEILHRVRDFSESHPDPLKIYPMHVPGGVARISGWSCAIDDIDLPVCKELEAVLRGVVGHPGDYVPRTWQQPVFFFDIAMGRKRPTMEA